MGKLNFVLGVASRDHQAVLLDQLVATAKQRPQDEYFYLVPNHIKFDSEINVLTSLAKRRGHSTGDFAAHRLQVLSFSRLAWYLLRDTPAFQQQRLSTIGLTMLTRSIIDDLADSLQIFGGEVHQPGFAVQLTRSLEELKTANITADDLASIVKTVLATDQPGRTWSAKLHDLVLVDQEYEKRLESAFLDNQQQVDLLVNYLADRRHADTVGRMHVYIDHFTQFTATEQRIVCALIKHAASTTISLVLDRPYRGRTIPEPNDLFKAAGLQYHRLVDFAKEHQQSVTLRPDVMATRQRVSTDMQTVEQFMIKAAREPVAGHGQLTDPHSVQFYTAIDRVGELNFVAGQIHRMVATGHYRYRDFLVLSRRLDPYQTMLRQIFNRHDVPIFDDSERSMAAHPLVTLLTALFHVKQSRFQLTDLMTLLKSGLLVPEGVGEHDFQTAVCITENWCLQRGINGAQFTDHQQWHYYLPAGMTASMKADADKKDAQLMMVKNFVRGKLVPFCRRLDQAENGQQLATILYQFLIETRVTDRLYDWQTYQAGRGNLDAARQPQQVWETFCGILDEYVLIFGQRPVNPAAADDSLTQFADLLQTGFSAATYSQVPATLDTVVVSETGIVQNDSHRVVFIIGATDDVMPEVKESTGLLTDADKDLLNAHLDASQYLPPDSIGRLENEPFINYLAFLSSRNDQGEGEELIFTAPEVSDDDGELRVSDYVTDLAKYLNCPIKRLPATVDPQAKRVAPFVSAPVATLGNLIQARRAAVDDHHHLGSSWQMVNRLLKAIPGDFHQLYRFVMSSLHYDNTPQRLNPEVAERLYTGSDNAAVGRTLYASITQLQDFYKNQYEYFLKNGLRLAKRDEFTLTPDRTGVFFHQCLQYFVERVNALITDPHSEVHDLADLANDEQAPLLRQLTDEAIDHAVSSEPEFAVLTKSTAQLSFQYRQLTKVVRTMTAVLCQQAARTTARPMAAEEQFGRDAGNDRHVLTPLSYDFQTARTHRRKRVYLRGRIDRVDKVAKQQLKAAAHDFLTVVDYKSGDKTFDLNEAYHGLALQLLTYLNSLAQNRRDIDADDQEAKLAGALYLHLSDPRFNYQQVRHQNPVTRELGAHQYKGILLDDPDLLLELDHGLKDRAPEVYSLKATKKRNSKKDSSAASQLKISAKKGSLLVTPDQLDWLMAHDRQLIIEAAREILDGADALNPYREGQGTNRRTGLDYTDYADVFCFDDVLDQGKYHDLDEQAATDALNEVNRPQTKKGEDDDA